jgi:hypothetical protein
MARRLCHSNQVSRYFALMATSRIVVCAIGFALTLTTPALSLFIMGLWMHEQGAKQLLCMRIRKLSLCMFSKLVAVPLIMVGLANGMNLNDEAGR